MLNPNRTICEVCCADWSEGGLIFDFTAKHWFCPDCLNSLYSLYWKAIAGKEMCYNERVETWINLVEWTMKARKKIH